jgi:hypothetical protein
VWLTCILEEVTNARVLVPTIKMDNTSAIALAKNLVLHDRSKHIDVKFHFTRECVERSNIDLEHVSTGDELVGILTKPLGRLQLQGLCGRIGVIEVSSTKPHKVGGVVDRVKCACVCIRQITGACVESGECPSHTVVIALRMACMRDSVIATRIVCCTGDARVMLSMASCVLWRAIWVEAYGRIIEKKEEKKRRWNIGPPATNSLQSHILVIFDLRLFSDDGRLW